MSTSQTVEAARADSHLGASTSSAFGIERQELSRINEEKDNEAVTKLGGVEGLCTALASSSTAGLSPDSVPSLAARQTVFGENRFKEVPMKGFLKLLFENLKDPTLLLLMAAALVSTVLGFAIRSQREEAAWTEGIAIWVAVGVVSLVGAGNDYQKDLQFKKLNAAKDVYDVKVVRKGAEALVPNTAIVVGDVLMLDTGDKVIADALLIAGHGLVVDEASLTGESEPVRKSPEDPWCRSGTQVTEGSGKALVLAVGTDSEWGRTMAMVCGEAGNTPLQEALTTLAAAIGKVGLAVGVLCFVVLLIRWVIMNKGFPSDQIASGPLQFFIFAVTIVVVAVPEGLPLAVTISLAYSMRKMMRDNNFVRVLAACETMGGATAICSDKTGTLTENRMTVVSGWFPDQLWAQLPGRHDLSPSLLQHILLNVALNSKAFLVETLGGAIECVGNRTECALLVMLRDWGEDYKALRTAHGDRVVEVYGFSSERKMASVLVRRDDGGLRLYNKGAAEIVLRSCTGVMTPGGEVQPLTESGREQLGQQVTDMASRGLRTLCLSYRDVDPLLEALPAAQGTQRQRPADEDLVACCIVGIKDPVRKEVPAAVATCKQAGIRVRMVTGDNKHTARQIAEECGILTPGGLVLEGPVFRQMPEEQLLQTIPQLQVLARSSPADKFQLVKALKKLGEVVAVTGDGTNDAPALKESDVGLAMGIAGTEVAKEAADIVILDDNFNSIVKSVLWGRSVFANLRKFLQFQLTINFAALVIAFVAAVTSGETPLNVLELLWINLIMDALAALALATEDPSPELLEEQPHGRSEHLINGRMWKHILVQGLYQIFVLFLVVYGAPAHLSKYALPSACMAFSNVDAAHLDVSLVNQGAVTGTLYNPRAPSPPGAHFEPNRARCTRGPCLDMCCNRNVTSTECLDNLASQGGHYLAGEVPLCYFMRDAEGQLICGRNQPKKHVASYCVGSSQQCPRYKQMKALYDQADVQYGRHVDHAQDKYNSIVFNAFIFLQLFNQINARKIKDELNVFKGLWRSRTFLYIWVLVFGLQLIIMLTPIRSFFRITSQTWEEWLFAIAIAVVALPLCLVTKLISRSTRVCRLPSTASLGLAGATSALPGLGLGPKDRTEAAHHELQPLASMPRPSWQIASQPSPSSESASPV